MIVLVAGCIRKPKLRRAQPPNPGLLYEELRLSYHNPETRLLTIDPYYGNLD